jgi:hypothetical protein
MKNALDKLQTMFGFVFGIFSLCMFQAMSSRKRFKVEIDDAIECIRHRMIVIEHGVLRSDLRALSFQFIYQTFQEDGWLSIFDAVNIYPRLVHEFYMNLKPYARYDTPYVESKVCGTKLRITPEVISEVTGILLTPDLSTPFLDTVTPPPRSELIECLYPNGECKWEEHRNKIPISYLHTPEHLFARVFMQNI